MNYNLNDLSASRQKSSTLKALRKLLQLIREERTNLLLALTAILGNSGLNLLAPYIIGRTIDKYVVAQKFSRCIGEWGDFTVDVFNCFLVQLHTNKNDGRCGAKNVIQIAKYDF